MGIISLYLVYKLLNSQMNAKNNQISNVIFPLKCQDILDRELKCKNIRGLMRFMRSEF